MDDHTSNLTYGASPKIFENARTLKKVMTTAEKILWNRLRNRKLKGFKFRRQHPIDVFIADFYCHEAKLVVEVDGRMHSLAVVKEYDAGRTHEIEKLGITVIRFTNEEVIKDINEVLEKIKFNFTSPLPSP